MFKALLLDMDGTLLDINFSDFMGEYLAGISARFADKIQPEQFEQQLLASTGAMLFNKSERTVEEAFLHDFNASLPLPDDAVERFEAYYEEDFPLLGKWGQPVAGARELIEAALAKGLPVVIATAPLFPEPAIMERLRWAGLADLPYHMVTTSTTMRRSKPTPQYYEEIAERIGVPPSQCFMVGDETVMDGAAAKAGMSVAFVGPEKSSANAYWLDRYAETPAIREKALEFPRLPDLAAVHEHLRSHGML